MDAQSNRVTVANAGPTTDGNQIVVAFVSAPENLARLDRIQAANKQLQDPRSLTQSDASALAQSQPVVVAIGCSIHATEIGATQAANELLYKLATADRSGDRSTSLRKSCVILIPMLNPDGHRLVVDWYERHKGTRVRRRRRCRGCITSTPATTSTATRS